MVTPDCRVCLRCAIGDRGGLSDADRGRVGIDVRVVMVRAVAMTGRPTMPTVAVVAVLGHGGGRERGESDGSEENGFHDFALWMELQIRSVLIWGGS